MFDYENLHVYKRATQVNKAIILLTIEHPKMDIFLKDQLKRASVSVVINIAEGSGYFSKPARRNFFTIARASTYECSALLTILYEVYSLEEVLYHRTKISLVEVSKMLFALIRRTF